MKRNTTTSVNPTLFGIKTLIPFVVGSITQKNTTNRSGLEFIEGFSYEVRKTFTTKNSKKVYV